MKFLVAFLISLFFSVHSFAQDVPCIPAPLAIAMQTVAFTAAPVGDTTLEVEVCFPQFTLVIVAATTNCLTCTVKVTDMADVEQYSGAIDQDRCVGCTGDLKYVRFSSSIVFTGNTKVVFTNTSGGPIDATVYVGWTN